MKYFDHVPNDDDYLPDDYYYKANETIYAFVHLNAAEIERVSIAAKRNLDKGNIELGNKLLKQHEQLSLANKRRLEHNARIK